MTENPISLDDHRGGSCGNPDCPCAKSSRWPVCGVWEADPDSDDPFCVCCGWTRRCHSDGGMGEPVRELLAECVALRAQVAVAHALAADLVAHWDGQRVSFATLTEDNWRSEGERVGLAMKALEARVRALVGERGTS